MVEGKKNIKKSEKALSQADFPKNPVISFSVLRATKAAVFDMKTTAFITFLASPILTHRNNSTLVQLAFKIQAFFKNTSAKMSAFFLSAASIT